RRSCSIGVWKLPVRNLSHHPGRRFFDQITGSPGAMFIRRLVINALIAAARNPTVQKKAGEAAGKAFDQARPNLMKASRRAGELTRKARNKINDMTDPK
ncbi:MAG: hypothetical protein VX017_09235, partial [Pseudomonadota bacterium]|nr:hypothetical protein [Pseudomonadota bacterium]